ncbi:hypothetical protein BGZ49_002450 [Haplosporangium sp. Z 27]|nr:hypothetical protein BGZ49_002450 [Haplosporangium sp. Z 27]
MRSATNRDIAITFVKRAPLLMRCIEYILQLQSVDNTYALRRLVIACASFTNSSDLWNKLEQASSQITMSKAWENLVTIYETTPWTISNNSNSILPSPETEGCNSIKIPGSFSSNVIQIIEQDIRPCFTHLKAKKMVDRARTTIELHKEKTKQIEAKMAEDSQGDLAGMTLMKQGQNGSKYNQKLMIAPVTDTPNDEENDWVAMDDEPIISSDNFSSQSQSWNKTFLGSVPVLEWCAQQPIQDPSQIHEAFMHLVGPILTMIDSPEYRHRIRGLNILTSFLIEYYGHPVSGPKNNIRKQVDSRIWIKIFDRTGLDQVLERSLKPLLGPLQVALTRSSALEDDNSDDGKLDNSDELEAISAAFRAYLTLILVNTEENNKPTSASERTRPITIGHGDAGRITNAPLAVEDLFVYAVLGSFKRPNPSKEYRTLIMEWARILISPVISLDFLRESSLSVVSKRDALDEVVEQGFRGIYGMGSLTIKYLPTLIQYTCDVLGFLFPSSPFSERLKSLDLAWRTSDVLQAVMEVSTPRIPRYRGKILASISNCWANSRIFPSETKVPESDKTLTKLSEAQLRLDQSLIKAMQLCIEICRSKITDDTSNGLEQDLKSLQGLDPAIFDPLFATE